MMNRKVVLSAVLAALCASSVFAQSAPTLTSLSPASVPAGAAATVTLNGTNLVSGSYVLVGGQFGNLIYNGPGNTPITYVSSTQMQVVISADMLTTPGPVSIQVESPSGAKSNALTLNVTTGGTSSNPVPTVTSISPSSATAGGPGFTLTVNGSNFVNGSTVQWGGAARTTTLVSASQLTAAIPASDIANAGTVAVTVFNPAPGGGTSGSATFVINAAVPSGPQGNRLPTIIWVLPINTTAGGPATTLTVSGANFVQGSTGQWNGANRPTTYVNSNTLKVSLSAGDIASPGSATLNVVTPAPGGGASAAWYYPLISPGVTTFPAGPQPVALGPVAAAVDPGLGRIYVVQREAYRDNGLNAGVWPQDAVTVVDQRTGAVLTTIGVGTSVNGEGQGIAVDSTRHLVYVTNADDGTVSVIDGAANTTVATTGVDKSPEGVAVDPAAGKVYVAGANVTLLDAGTGAALASVPVGGPAWAVAVDRTTHLAYVLVNSIPQSIAVLDSSGTVRTKIQLRGELFTRLGIAVDPGQRVYTSDYQTGTIEAFDITGSSPASIGSFSSAPQYVEAVAVDSSSHLVYAVESGGSVNVFSASGAKQKSIPVLRAPVAIAIDQVSGRAYVVDSYSETLSIVDTAQLAAAGTIPLGVQPMGLALDAAVQRLYAANYIADAVSVLDTAHRTPVASWPSGGYTWAVAVDPALRQVYAVNSNDGTVSIFSTLDGSLKARLSAGAKGASTIAVNSTTGMVYVSNGGLTGAVTVINGRTNQAAGSIAVGSRPVGIAIDEAANRVYVANQQSGTISVIDGAANRVTATWQPPQGNVWKLAVDPSLHHLYVTIPPTTLGAFSGLETLDSSTGAAIGQLGGSSAADDVAVNPATHHVFIGDSGNGTVSVVDGATLSALAQYVTGTAVDGLAVDSAAGLVYASNVYDATIGIISDQPSGPAISSGGIVSAGSFSGAQVTPGGIIAVFGSNLASTTLVASSAPWPTSLGGVSVLVNGLAAPIYFVSPGQIDFQMPWQFLGQSQVSVSVNGSAAQTITLAAAGPAIFAMNSQGQGAIQIANTALLAAPAGAINGMSSRPAARGDYITIYCTGLGDVTNRPASGAAAVASPLSTTVAVPAVTIGGVQTSAIFSGLAPGFVGLYVVNAQVPAGAPSGSAVAVALTLNGAKSNTVTIAVQ